MLQLFDNFEKNVQKLQNKATRIFTRDNYDIQLKQLLEKLGRKTLEKRRVSKLEITYVKSGASEDR